VLAWIDRLFTEHQFMRRFVLFWAMGMITWLTWWLFFERGNMTMDERYAYLGVVGMFATAVGMYTWKRTHRRHHKELGMD